MQALVTGVCGSFRRAAQGEVDRAATNGPAKPQHDRVFVV